MKCPNCGKENPDSALICDCGYNFDTKKMETNNSSQLSDINHSGGFFSFDKMLSVSLIKILYILGALGIIIFSIVIFIRGSQARYGGSAILLSGVAYLVLGNLLWRIFCEGIIIIFKIHEKLSEIERKMK